MRHATVVLPGDDPGEAAAPEGRELVVLGAALIGLGFGGIVYRIVTKKGGFPALFLSCVAISVGASLTASKAAGRRNRRVREARQAVAAELDQLDPIGRAQVLASVAGTEASRYRRPGKGLRGLLGRV